MTLPAHKTRIVATIGPASDAPEMMERMIRAGMNVARLNLSHGTFEEHARRVVALREASRTVGREIAILADLPGPKLRIGPVSPDPVELAAGQPFTLTTRPMIGSRDGASVSFEPLPRVVKPGDGLFLNDGLIQLEVERVNAEDVRCRVLVGGGLGSRKGLNLPGIDLGVGAFTPRDRECLAFAIEQGVDAVSQSFVESDADIRALRDAAASLGGDPFVIAKIERASALDHLDAILAAADGLMVARGDLGVEVPIERIAILQKILIRKAVRAARPVITATQMLESMTVSRQPTRAEATDVANAVLDGTDAVMLSGESATGRYPVESVETLARIAAATEPHRPSVDLWERLKSLTPDMDLDVPDLFAVSVETLMACSRPAAVVVPARTGSTARSICSFRLPVWIAAPTSSLAVLRRLLFSYGVEPLLSKGHAADWTEMTRRWVREQGLPGRLAILVRGPSASHPGSSPALELVDVNRPEKNGRLTP
ncbi:MAG: pyruvate kinase [Candidatus Polarisedimenticolia bacterium]